MRFFQYLVRDVGPEFLEYASYGTFRGDHKTPLKGQRYPAVTCWIVEVRDAAGGKIPQQIGVVWTPASVVVLAPESGANGVKKPRVETSRALAKDNAGLVSRAWGRLHCPTWCRRRHPRKKRPGTFHSPSSPRRTQEIDPSIRYRLHPRRPRGCCQHRWRS